MNTPIAPVAPASTNATSAATAARPVIYQGLALVDVWIPLETYAVPAHVRHSYVRVVRADLERCIERSRSKWAAAKAGANGPEEARGLFRQIVAESSRAVLTPSGRRRRLFLLGDRYLDRLEWATHGWFIKGRQRRPQEGDQAAPVPAAAPAAPPPQVDSDDSFNDTPAW